MSNNDGSQYSKSIISQSDQNYQNQLKSNTSTMINNVGLIGLVNAQNQSFNNASIVQALSNNTNSQQVLSSNMNSSSNSDITQSTQQIMNKQGLNNSDQSSHSLSISSNNMSNMQISGNLLTKSNNTGYISVDSNSPTNNNTQDMSGMFKPQISNYNMQSSVPNIQQGSNGMMNTMNASPMLAAQMPQHNPSYMPIHGASPQNQATHLQANNGLLSNLQNNQNSDINMSRQIQNQNNVQIATNLSTMSGTALQNQGIVNNGRQNMQMQQQQMPMAPGLMYNANGKPGIQGNLQNVGQISQQQQVIHHQMQQQQSSIVGTSSSGIGNTKILKRNWHQGDHTQTRSTMVDRIITLLKQRRPNATEDWHEKLPHMAKRLEEALFSQAEDLNQYSDANTLKARLQQLALSMGGKQAVRHNEQARIQPHLAGNNQSMSVPQGMHNQTMPQQIYGNQGTMLQQQPSAYPNGQPIPGNNSSQSGQQINGNYLMNNPASVVSAPNNQYMFGPGGPVNQVNPSSQINMLNNQTSQSMNQAYANSQNGSMPNDNSNSQVSIAQRQQQQQQQQFIGQANPTISANNVHLQQLQSQQQSIMHTGNGTNIQQPMIGNMNLTGANNDQNQSTATNVPGTTRLSYNQQQSKSQPNSSQVSGAAPAPVIYQQPMPMLPQQQLFQRNTQQMQQQVMLQNQVQGQNPVNSQSLGHNVAPSANIPSTLPTMNGSTMPGNLPSNLSNTLNPNIAANNLASGLNSGQQQVATMMNQSLGLNHQQQHLIGAQQSQQGMQGSVGMDPGSANGAHSEEHRRQVLKQQQQRLLLLRHASKCPHDAGRCPVTPHCANMKALWKHIMSCKDQDCKIAHCVSSRYVLSHYSKCKDQQCPVCAPVREAIRRNYERSKEIVKSVSDYAINPKAVGSQAVGITGGMQPSTGTNAGHHGNNNVNNNNISGNSNTGIGHNMNNNAMNPNMVNNNMPIAAMPAISVMPSGGRKSSNSSTGTTINGIIIPLGGSTLTTHLGGPTNSTSHDDHHHHHNNSAHSVNNMNAHSNHVAHLSGHPVTHPVTHGGGAVLISGMNSSTGEQQVTPVVPPKRSSKTQQTQQKLLAANGSASIAFSQQSPAPMIVSLSQNKSANQNGMNMTNSTMTISPALGSQQQVPNKTVVTLSGSSGNNIINISNPHNQHGSQLLNGMAGGDPKLGLSNGQIIMPGNNSSNSSGSLLGTSNQSLTKSKSPIYPLDSISCAIYNFSPDQIASHFKTIHEGMRLSAQKIKETFTPVIDDLLKIPNVGSVFGSPVDPTALNLPDYFEIIKLPMDLGSIKKRLETSGYRDVQNLVFDVHLTFSNAMTYNPKGSEVFALAKELKKTFDQRHKTVMNEIERSIQLSREHSDACLICGEVKLLYEPPVYYCNGKCGGQRIRRGAVFYSTQTNNYHWCNPCYSDLKDSQTIRLPDCTISRLELVKKKHNEDSEESWVECEGPCGRWVHQICGLFNGRRNIGDECHFVCPNCLTEKRKKASSNEIIVAPTTKKMKASDLPHCNLSQLIEKRIYERLSIAYQETALKRGISIKDVEKCPNIYLRQVSCYDKQQHVREGVYERYKHKSYPQELPCRTKCVILFQNIDGQDVILFGMYVYEYGHKCPQPNQRRVYISYLDSVHYFRPKQYRTLVYHEILISYLDYIKARGFHTAHIWACPPQKGDDYILYVHPPDQKTPKPDKLRNWYQDMLLAAKARGIVLEINDLHSEFMLDPSNDATVLPYFEGDYWVNEAEVIIKDLANPSSNINSGLNSSNIIEDQMLTEDKISKRKSKNKRTSRSNVKQLSVSSKYSERDALMAKLSSMIEPMKDTFFVVRLHPKEYADNCIKMRQLESLKEAGGNYAAVNGGNGGNLGDMKDDVISSNFSSNSNNGMFPSTIDLDQNSIVVNYEGTKLAYAQSNDSASSLRSSNSNVKFSEVSDSFVDIKTEKSDASTVAIKSVDDQSIDTVEIKSEHIDDSSKVQVDSSANVSVVGNEDIIVKEEPAVSGNSKEIEIENSLVLNEQEGSQPVTIGVQVNKKRKAIGLGSDDNPLVSPTKRSKDTNSLTDHDSSNCDVETDSTANANMSVNATSLSRTTAVDSDDNINCDNNNRDDQKPQKSSDDLSQNISLKKIFKENPDLADSKFDDHDDKITGDEPSNVTADVFEKLSTQNEFNQFTTENKFSSSALSGSSGNSSPSPFGSKEEKVAYQQKLSVSNDKEFLPYTGLFSDVPSDIKDDTEDIDDIQESEHFDSRQSVLNLCQGNHYQFDQLRRAKHTSMMVLYHIHNPDAPKFVPSCSRCHKDILVGFRYHCEGCDVDYCQPCLIENPFDGSLSINGANVRCPSLHPHSLQALAISTGAATAPKSMTEEQRKERQRSIQLHMQLLQHAANCADNSECKSRNCAKMKDFLRHDNTCQVKASRGCRLCIRINNLLQLHARSCRSPPETCRVPHCDEIREHIRQMELRQQEMDDRRRKMINNKYRNSADAVIQNDDD